MPLTAERIGANLLGRFGLQNRVAVAIGCAGVLGTDMAKGLAGAGARVAVLDISPENGRKCVEAILADGGEAKFFEASALDRGSLIIAREAITRDFGVPELLLNAAGGNKRDATVRADLPFAEISLDAWRSCFQLNIDSVLLGCQVFGPAMVQMGKGSILNIASINALNPLTNIPAYSAAKAAVANFTKWLALTWAPRNVRVNALIPGFFLSEQNRFLLIDEKTGEPTARGRAIIAHTPMGRYGQPDDLVGMVIYLLSDASKFTTGTLAVVDGGFDSFRI